MNLDDILKWLPLMINAITEGKILIDKITADLEQNAEMTPEQEKAFDEAIQAKEASPAWQQQP